MKLALAKPPYSSFQSPSLLAATADPTTSRSTAYTRDRGLEALGAGQGNKLHCSGRLGEDGKTCEVDAASASLLAVSLLSVRSPFACMVLSECESKSKRKRAREREQESKRERER